MSINIDLEVPQEAVKIVHAAAANIRYLAETYYAVCYYIKGQLENPKSNIVTLRIIAYLYYITTVVTYNLKHEIYNVFLISHCTY